MGCGVKEGLLEEEEEEESGSLISDDSEVEDLRDGEAVGDEVVGFFAGVLFMRTKADFT